MTSEQRQYMVDAKLESKGYEQNTTLGSVQPLKVPQGARAASIQAISQNIRWRDDGTDPTLTIGMQLTAGSDMFYTGDLVKIRFIEEAASAELNVSYYF